MTRTLLILGASLLCRLPMFGTCSNTSLGNGFTCIQAKNCNQVTSCAWTSNLGSGHAALVLTGGNYTGSTGWAPTSTNNAYTVAVGPITVNGNQENEIFVNCNTAAGAETVTFFPNGTLSYQDYYLVEISGGATGSGTGCLESITANNSNSCNTTATSCTTGNFTSSSADLVLGHGLAGNANPAAGTGFTQIIAGDNHFLAETKTGTAATDSASITGTSAAAWLIAGVALKASGGAASTSGFNKRGKLEKLDPQ